MACFTASFNSACFALSSFSLLFCSFAVAFSKLVCIFCFSLCASFLFSLLFSCNLFLSLSISLTVPMAVLRLVRNVFLSSLVRLAFFRLFCRFFTFAFCLVIALINSPKLALVACRFRSAFLSAPISAAFFSCNSTFFLPSSSLNFFFAATFSALLLPITCFISFDILKRFAFSLFLSTAFGALLIFFWSSARSFRNAAFHSACILLNFFFAITFSALDLNLFRINFFCSSFLSF